MRDIVRGIAEIPDQKREKERAVQLLLGAVRTLPEQDQDVVLALLLQGLTNNETWEQAVRRGDEQGRIVVALSGSTATGGAGIPAHQRRLVPQSEAKVVPVRFPPKLYEELKGWCEQHKFPMAAVVRGLVERFLESQDLP
ncbi:MAG TPA: hypothetical protein VG228_04825 [Solirubrobacteraceae bacterium]|nr:hypothetical protein [Solirubrobacteraceae bacterium]